MDVLESVASTLLDSGIPYGHRKSCERAVQLKNRGNTYFAKCQAGDTRRAVQLYTEVHEDLQKSSFVSRARLTGYFLCTMARSRAEKASGDIWAWAVVARRQLTACSR